MIAICVGHSRPGDSGAVSVDETTEHCFNRALAGLIAEHLDAAGVKHKVVASYQGSSYAAAMRWLGRELAKFNPVLAVELHFNAAENPAASGHEWLFWGESARGREAASWLDRAMRETFPKLPARGIKGLGRGDRGNLFLKATPCAAVIAEPFFGSHAGDWEAVSLDGGRRLAMAIASGLVAAHEVLSKGRGA